MSDDRGARPHGPGLRRAPCPAGLLLDGRSVVVTDTRRSQPDG